MERTPKLHAVKEANGNGRPGPAIYDILIRKLETIGPVSEAECEAIRAVPGRIRQLRPYEDIVSEGDQPNVVALLVDGFACRYKLLEDGRRQILSFHIPGDIPDVQSLFLDKMDHSLGTLVSSKILHVEHKDMLQLFGRAPTLAQLFWRGTLIDASIFREWMVGLGRMDAYTRLARMLCEIVMQMRSVGLSGEDHSCELPLTQSEIADATGMSTVHVNRTLQTLRANGLLTFEGGSLTVLDWDGLQKAGEFDPAYLHLRKVE